MELNATGKVILGMLAARPRSGYEIKQIVDSSARFFWAASYGQIYPELRRLEEAGLIDGQAGFPPGRAPAHRLQADRRGPGRAARAWIAAEPEVFEMRDEGLLSSSSPARSSRLASRRSRASALPPRAPRQRSFARSLRRSRRPGGRTAPRRSRMVAR